ncbi:MAG TPA: GTPase Era [Ignavibacteriales bacterium]|nr:GTPase Era [Ignavibacteriales bacterium]HOL82194.1 GTPase Era [Ignavibacteriales bacterium]HOM66308.1 GTPase Era [Ignavibacteriales bacterium]HPD67995.1 GTPase Era [Ignavibacteriales bacterium]HPP34427.1 GTPase Era [Ignavibacteriales bacterium]
MNDHKAGYVAIIGLPNAGKSTLLNSILGQKLTITSPKPQTTRKSILGILSEENYQIIFIDTPGILKPNYLLQEKMLKYIINSLNDADILLIVIDIEDDPKAEKFMQTDIFPKLKDIKTKKILVLNKIDLYKKNNYEELYNYYKSLDFFDHLIAVSAITGMNVNDLVDLVVEHLPVHPKYYPEDYLSNENERFFCREIIREKIFTLFGEEIPFSCEVLINEFKERENAKDFIDASIVVEKESQKPIIIGKGGKRIKQIGEMARKDIENFLDREVYLQLNVIVKENWRQNPKLLNRFGYIDEE